MPQYGWLPRSTLRSGKGTTMRHTSHLGLCILLIVAMQVCAYSQGDKINIATIDDPSSP